MNAPARIDAFWSMQSPYCYFALDRLLALDTRPDAEVVLRPVRPAVLRVADRYADRDPLEQAYFERDVRRTAAFLGLPYGDPDPSPVAFSSGLWVASAVQPRIGRLYGLLMAAVAEGQGLAFIDRAMRLIWDGRTKGWDRGTHLNDAIRAAGLSPDGLAERAERERESLDAQLRENEAAMLESGHWGVPLFVLGGEPFYGQDRIDQLVWRLEGGQ